MAQVINHAGEVFGNLMALRQVDKDKCGYFIWEFECSCGAIVRKRMSTIIQRQKRGENIHCGCKTKRVTKRWHGTKYSVRPCTCGQLPTPGTSYSYIDCHNMDRVSKLKSYNLYCKHCGMWAESADMVVKAVGNWNRTIREEVGF